jgi:predicted esterase YcpF (UPF0227 family)
MKLLYFPGIQSILADEHDFAQSYKLVLLMQICHCDVFDYRNFDAKSSIDLVRKYDVLFGASFGGYFAFNMAVITGQSCISVNPSLYLDKRFAMLMDKHPNKLSFIKPAQLEAIKAEPLKNRHPNIHILMNMDDEVLDAEKIVGIAGKFGCNIYRYEKGGHESTNFIGEMLPTIKQILSGS